MFSEFLTYFQNFLNIFRISEIFPETLKYFQIFSEFQPKSLGDLSVTSELDSESLTMLRKIFLNVVRVSPCGRDHVPAQKRLSVSFRKSENISEF